MENNRNFLSALIAVFAGIGGIQHAKAQSDTGAMQLEEVIVTAQKRAESLQDVPVAVTAFSNEALSDFGIRDMKAIQAVTPGLVFSNSGAFAQPYLRGVGTRLAINGLDPSVAVYMDDRYVSRSSASLFDFADVARVEVLKGPQGTLYGRNATGGAIRVISQGVAEELEGSVKAMAGNHGAYSLSGTVSIPFSEDFGARFSGMVKQRDGYADNLVPTGASELDDQDFQAYRARFRWDMSDTATANLILNYWEKDDLSGNDIVDLSPPGLNVGIALGGITGTDPDEVATAVSAKDTGDESSAQLRFDIELDAIDLVSITTYTDYAQDYTTDADGTSTNTLDVPLIPDEAKDFSQEFQLVSNNNSDWNWIVGAYYFTSDADFEFVLDVGQPILFSQGFQNVETEAWALFGQTTWNLSDSWAITLGGRYSAEEKEVDLRASTLAGVTVVPTPFSDKDDWSEFTPKVTLEYLMDDSMLYLTYARGFKSGGFNYPAVGSKSLDPEILDMLELGFKGDLADNRLRLNSALFYYDYKDLQVTRAGTGEGATATTENAADAAVFGLDLDITWLATMNFELMAGLSLLESEYEDYPASAQAFNATLTGMPDVPGMSNVAFDADGESMLRAPDFSAFVSARYEFRAGDARMPLVVTYSYTDKYEFDFVADPLARALEQDSYSLVSARFSYIAPSENWSVAIWGNNLTDEEYFDDVVANSRGIRGSYGVPRTYGVEMDYHF